MPGVPVPIPFPGLEHYSPHRQQTVTVVDGEPPSTTAVGPEGRTGAIAPAVERTTATGPTGATDAHGDGGRTAATEA